MNMSEYSCRVIKLNNGPNERIKLEDIVDWILVYGAPKTHSWTP